MRFRQIGLQFKSLLGQTARFLAMFRCALVCPHQPAFQLRITCERESEVWIQLDGALIKLRALFQFYRVLISAGKIMRLHKCEVSLAVFGRLSRHLRFLGGRKLCLERVGNFTCQIALELKNVGHIAVVIVGPDVLVGVGID